MRNRDHLRIVLALALLVAVILAYVPVFNANFVNYDDGGYVTKNSWVKQGLHWENVKWAFTTLHFANWHPLTWLSHMLDVELFGLKAGGHHVTSVVLHALSTVLIFLILERCTGALWRPALVALVFGLHPIQVESVAWISERKNVLSMFLGLGAVWFYARYALGRGWFTYGLTFGCFALSLLAKPMLVTLPFVFLLLDYWPFKRVRFTVRSLAALTVEKIPLFALSAFSSVMTVIAQSASGSVLSLTDIPFHIRAANAVQAYFRYLGNYFWPTRLVVYYPHPVEVIQVVPTVLASVALVVVSGLCLWKFRARPYWAVGWFWYLGAFVPMIGLVQVGSQSMADRYMYFPILGITLALAWTLPDRLASTAPLRRLALACAAALFVVLSVLTWRQASHWKNPRTLFSHAIEAHPSNIAFQNMGAVYLNEGDGVKAEENFRRALAMVPREFELLDSSAAKHSISLANALLMQDRVLEAEGQLINVIQQFPHAWEAYKNLGNLRIEDGRPEEAIVPLQEAMELQPENHEVLALAGNAYLKSGHLSSAIPAIRHALRLDPYNPNYWINMGIALSQAERYDEAREAFERAIELRPTFDEAHYNYGFYWAVQEQYPEAREAFLETLALNPEHRRALFHISSVELMLGRYDEAKRYLTRLLAIAPNHADAKANMESIEALLSARPKRDFSQED